MSWWSAVDPVVVPLLSGAAAAGGMKMWYDLKAERRAQQKAEREDLRAVCANFVATVGRVKRIHTTVLHVMEPMRPPAVTNEMQARTEMDRRIAEFTASLADVQEALDRCFQELVYSCAAEQLVTQARTVATAAFEPIARSLAQRRSSAPDMSLMPGLDYQREKYKFQNMVREALGHEPLPQLATLDELIALSSLEPRDE
jgi:hypothetical protein